MAVVGLSLSGCFDDGIEMQIVGTQESAGFCAIHIKMTNNLDKTVDELIASFEVFDDDDQRRGDTFAAFVSVRPDSFSVQQTAFEGSCEGHYLRVMVDTCRMGGEFVSNEECMDDISSPLFTAIKIVK